MSRMRALMAWLCLLPVFGGGPAKAQIRHHAGMCDPSGAVAWPEDGFTTFIVANDEDNRLRIYTHGDEAPPRLLGGDLGAFLGQQEQERQREADLEAATWLGGRIYWIGSHGRNSKGKPRAGRSVFLATTATPGGDGAVALAPFGSPRDLRPALARAGLAQAIGGDAADPDLAPERHGLNIEGLAARPDGASLLIGLRNPLREGKAIVIPFENPEAVVERGAEPRLGAPLLLDLGGLGIRSIEYVPARSEYVIAAGPRGDPGEGARYHFGLFRWSGRAGDRPEPVAAATQVLTALRDQAGWFAPEAVIVDRSGRQALLLSDDGDRRLRPGTRCKDLPEAERRFRSIILDLP
ncbi:Alkaline phosphatase [Rhodovastum atsumiense]|uniref:DUF3616 domain-containing protein n=1 Tax=Rhodovastum atsumiense TaxID=504468 RepID=A0A5M6ITF6_9PROT|nr:DUF3616 domain-containing protein [Rhodovastum atsumiense]KAA5611199.1 DUF3616 domain-containing protein [Rhodovastum atsumiense]CAH2602493.1 Alkaline phosphatase [Rhodovastum atsumiense]